MFSSFKDSGLALKTLAFVSLALLIASRAQAVPDIRHWQTQTGTPVLFIEAHQLPMVDIEIVFNAGAARDGDKAGLATLTNSLLSEGAAGQSAAELAARFEDVGAQKGGSSLRDMNLITLRSLSKPAYLRPALDAFQDLLGEPDFPEDAFERNKRQMLIGLEAEQQNPRAIASRLFMETLFEGHPYANSPAGTEATINAITRSDVVEFYRTFMVAENAVIAIVGDLGAEQAAAIAEQLSAALPRGAKAPPLPPIPKLSAAKTVEHYHPSSQTHIYMGGIGISRHSKDYYALKLGNHALGGGALTSILFDELRGKRGLTYGIGSRFTAMQTDGPFTVNMQTRNAQVAEAVTVLRDQLKKFASEGTDSDTLEAARKNLTGSFPLGIASNASLLSNLALIGFYDLPLDFLDSYVDRINALSEEQVRDAFARHVDGDKLLTVIVGGGAKKPDDAEAAQ